MTKTRRIIEDPVYQGIREKVAYELDTEPWGGNPTEVSVSIWLEDEDVSETFLTGDPTILGHVISTPIFTGLTANRFKVRILFTIGVSVLEANATLIGED